LISREDLLGQLEALRRDLYAAQAKLTAALELAARLPPDPSREVECPRCGVRRPTEALMNEHLENVHGWTPD
jgi:hypothetical protein